MEMEMEMEIHHFSHEHPLILDLEKINDDEKIRCKGCGQSTPGFAIAYRCTGGCDFYLHKFCAELPAQIQAHSLHRHHPLILLPKPPYKDSTFQCDACNECSDSFTYHCFVCNFDLNISCAVRSQIVEHRSHKHPLRPLLSPSSFDCCACGEKHSGFSYQCDVCKFWIHQDCAALPTAIKHDDHVHPLALCYSFMESYMSFACYICSICNETASNNFWCYRCEGCDFAIHVKCSTKTREGKTGIKIEDVDDTDLIHLPAPDESVDLIGHFIKQISQESNKRETSFNLFHQESVSLDAQFLNQIILGDSNKEAELINHFSHNHPLTLFNMQSGSSGDGDDSSKQKDDKICNTCMQPISASFYGCVICDFFVHKWCAELPTMLQHPCHPHPLILLRNNLKKLCNGCGFCCKGLFTYECDECECYCLDLICASLPSSIVYEVHDHPLLLREHCVVEGCAACDWNLPMFSFGCDTCAFNLHYLCAMLPRTIRHRYDEHPFTLNFAPIRDEPNEYFCEICEKDINPKWWFYHCIDCDQSLCAKCMHKGKKYPMIKCGSACDNDSRSHRPSLVLLTKKGPLCDACHERILDDSMMFKCTECDVTLHLECAGPIFEGYE